MKSKVRGIPASTKSLPALSDDDLGMKTQYLDDDEEIIEPRAAKPKTPVASTKDRKATVDYKNALTAWRIGLLGLLGVNIAFGLIIVGMLGSAVSRSSPTLVTRGNGQTETIDFLTGSNRPPSVIKLFAEKTISEIYTWRNYLPQKGSPPDPGIELPAGGKIPTTVYQYTFALEPAFAESFRAELAKLREVAAGEGNNRIETIYTPQIVGEPESLGTGKWAIKVSGFQLISNGNASTAPTMVRIDVQLTVRAVPPPILSEVEQSYPDPGIAKAVMNARAMGLEITNVTSLSAKKATQN